MKKLELKFGSIKEMLTKDQMKMISGGYYSCGYTINSSCGGGVGVTTCNGGYDYCQGWGDGYCANSDCCDDIDCH